MKLLLVIFVFAAATYLAVRWLQDHGYGDQPAKPRPTRPKPPTRPIAPDDDEGFLRDLDWKRRQHDRNRDQQPPDQPEV